MTGHRTPTDWFLFVLLATMWASAFALTKIAVDGLPPGLIVTSRLAIASLIMAAVMVAQGERLPPLSNRPAWKAIIGMGIFGTAAPFYLITQGQRTIDSSLAALLISSAPLFVAAMAHFSFADERLTWNKITGILVGFAGVALLLGPDALGGVGDAGVIAQLLCLGGGFCYAVNTIIARGAPALPMIVLPTGFLTMATLASLPAALLDDYSGFAPSVSNIGAVITLGAIPSAAAGVLMMHVVKTTSATFLSLTGYLIPVISAILGYFAFGEVQDISAAAAFALILGGVWLSQKQTAPPPIPRQP
ncbi:MAG: DMT family transporter [Pseudomonadota bacterium]